MKSKKKVIAILIAVILVALLAGAAYLYFCTDMFKTPEELFYKYLGKMAKNESDYSYQDTLNDLKASESKSYKSNSNVGIELKAKGSDYTSRRNQVTYDEINKIKLELETKNIPAENKKSNNIKLAYNDETITELNLLKTSDIYGIKSEFLDDKYIAVENKNLKSLMRKLGQDSSNIPDQYENIDIYDLLYISKEDQDKIVNTYQDVIRNNISSDKYKKVDNVIQNVNGKDLNTTVYSLSMNQPEFYSVIIKILETAKQDNTILNLIVDKANKLYNINQTEITKESLIEKIEDLIEDMQDDMEYADETSTSEIVLYVENEEIVRIELKDDNEVQTAMDFYTVGNEKHIDLLENQYSYNNQLTKIMGIKYETTENENETTVKGSITIYDDYDEVGLSFDMTTKGKVGEGNNETTSKYSIETEDMVITLKIDSQIEYTDDLEIEEISDKNSTILNDMSKTEIEEFFNKVGEKFQKVLIEKMVDMGLIDERVLSTLNSNPDLITNVDIF